MEYHGHDELHQGHPHDTSHLSSAKEHLPLSDETIDRESSKKDEEEEEDQDPVATSHLYPSASDQHSSSKHLIDDRNISIKHQDGSKEKVKHNNISESTMCTDVPLKDDNNVKKNQNVNNSREDLNPLPLKKRDDVIKNASNKELPLEDSASDNVQISIKKEENDPPSSTKAATPHDSSSTSAHISTDFTDSFLLRSFLTRPQLRNPPVSHVATGIPQRPLFMLPPIPQPFLMLPHHLSQPQWPIVPFQSSPQKIPATDFIPFSALTADSVIQKHTGGNKEKQVKKKQSKVGRKQKKNEDAANTAEDGGYVRYKTEYRKTNRASTMLICDKIKLPHKKPSRKFNLVDISDGAMGESSTGDKPIAELVKGQTEQENVALNVSSKIRKMKRKATTSKPAGAKKTKKVKPGISKKSKVGGANQKCQNEQKIRQGKKAGKSGVKKQTAKTKLQQVTDLKLPRPRPKKKPQLTPEKMLYNKLTQVVKQIAEPNIFSPLILPPNLEIKCSYCDTIYPDRKSLWEHIQIHLKKPVPFRLSKYYRFCKVCRKYVSEIRDHIRAVHFDGGTPYGCPKCHERFRYKGLLRNHIQNRHTTARNYMCEICGLAFKQSVTLRKHKMVHTDEKDFFCSTCGKAFKTMYALQKHVVVHAVVKPYRCEICDKQFTQQTNMKSHMRTHTGEKPYQCDMCTMAFTHNVSLKTHKKKQHGVDMWKDPTHSQTSKLVASSQPNVKMVIKFINELGDDSGEKAKADINNQPDSNVPLQYTESVGDDEAGEKVKGNNAADE
ncbi:uncharacterized protein [Amphiura filiformis]|uniref:uncharacterized protein n=1 Tax=Amphiura filiformis TaxID=82378 RepID=UPI003B217E74